FSTGGFELSQFDSQLASLGWDLSFDDQFREHAAPGEVPARVLADFAAEYLVHDGMAPRRVRARQVDPAVGDWVGVEGDAIKSIVPRRTSSPGGVPGPRRNARCSRPTWTLLSSSSPPPTSTSAARSGISRSRGRAARCPSWCS